ncbi:FAD/NAD(P)-binding protein [Amycolatopsis magusensis]|uniref:FAD/NAD(P)-binding protein n=1 Tax=Amycolatopsis magusensis TaxID=882444 RepID=UPI003C30D6E6
MRIGIVGAGAAGASVLDMVVRGLGRQTARSNGHEVTVFDPSMRFGPGRAYRPGSEKALLNLPARMMSVRPDEPEQFANWLVGKGSDPTAGNEFLPRSDYARYLEDVVAFAVTTGRLRDVRTTLVGDRIVSLARESDVFSLHTSTADEYLFDAVFLCPGTTGPMDIYGLTGRPGFVSEPYPLDKTVSRIGRDHTVAVLGTGLTAIDVVLELAASGHRGRILAVSRSGYLPGVRYPGPGPTLATTNEDTVIDLATTRGYLSSLDIFRLLRAEFRAHQVPISDLWREISGGEAPEKRFLRHVAEAQDNPRWHMLLVAVAHHLVDKVWPLFDDSTRVAFLRDWHGVCGRLCAPMPQRSAEELAALLHAGQLRLVGGIETVVADEDGFLVQAGSQQYFADHVVNSVRPRVPVLPHRVEQLIDSMVRNGLAVPHPFGGIRIDTNSGLVRGTAGSAVPGLYALGELTVGERYVETTILGAITRRAQQAVRHLLDRDRP